MEEISNLYHECSGIDIEDIPNLSQKWVEQDFKEEELEQENLFVEPKLDKYLHDCSFGIDPKVPSLGSTNA